MSNRRPPKAAWHDRAQTASEQARQSNVSIADHEDETLSDDHGHDPADAATLGFADLAERAPAPELAEFRDLRARLFGDLDVSAPTFEETEIDDHRLDEQVGPQVFIPEQVSIANGAVTAAQIPAEAADDGADSEDEDDDVAESGLRDDVEPEARAIVPTQAEPAELDHDPADLSAAPATPSTADPATVESPMAEPEPSPASGPDPATGGWVFGGTTTATPETTSDRRRGPVVAVAAAVAVAALIIGWFVLSGEDGSNEATTNPAEPPQASQASKAQAASIVELDGEALRTSQQFTFDDAISQITLSLPSRAAGSAAEGFDVQVTDIEVSVPGQPIQQVDSDLGAGSGSVTIDLGQLADAFSVSYTSAGAVERTEPSSAHRAIVLVTPIRIAAAEGSTGLVTVKGSQVLNLGCATADQAMEACGQQTDEGWEVAVPTLDTDVIAQVDLPE